MCVPVREEWVQYSLWNWHLSTGKKSVGKAPSLAQRFFFWLIDLLGVWVLEGVWCTTRKMKSPNKRDVLRDERVVTYCAVKSDSNATNYCCSVQHHLKTTQYKQIETYPLAVVLRMSIILRKGNQTQRSFGHWMTLCMTVWSHRRFSNQLTFHRLYCDVQRLPDEADLIEISLCRDDSRMWWQEIELQIESRPFWIKENQNIFLEQLTLEDMNHRERSCWMNAMNKTCTWAQKPTRFSKVRAKTNFYLASGWQWMTMDEWVTVGDSEWRWVMVCDSMWRWVTVGDSWVTIGNSEGDSRWQWRWQ